MKGLKLFAAAAVAVLALCVVVLVASRPSGIVCRAFDVGQGDACLFTFPDGTTMLVDAGPVKSSQALVSKMRRAGASRVDLFVATHPHEDHIGGAKAVIEAFDVGRVWDCGFEIDSPVRDEMMAAIERRAISFGVVRAGHRAEIGGGTVEVLAPVREIRGTESEGNDNCIVLLVRYGDMSFLMMSDAEEAERADVDEFPSCVVMKVSHHGATNGTDSRLLDEARPNIAVLTYGRGNRHGHPSAQTMALLAERGVETFATADGDVVIRSDGRRYTVSRSER